MIMTKSLMLNDWRHKYDWWDESFCHLKMICCIYELFFFQISTIDKICTGLTLPQFCCREVLVDVPFSPPCFPTL